ncbi:DUF1080 domain-containing protein [Verrucomicrobia bacterium]|nr:DUF1080 domain-containing protein [Verrucomicrobiota bacterium]
MSSLIWSTAAQLDPALKKELNALDSALKNNDLESLEKAITALVEIGEPAVPVLAIALNDRDQKIRWTAIYALGKFDKIAKGAVQPLIAALSNTEDAAVQRQITSSLVSIGRNAHETIPTFIRALAHKNPAVRRMASSVLAQFDPPAKKAIPRLMVALTTDDDPLVRWNSASTLGKIGPEAKEAVPALIKALCDHSTTVRMGSAVALKQIGPAAKDAIPALTALLSDKNNTLRIYSAFALQAITPDAKGTAGTIAEVLKNEKPLATKTHISEPPPKNAASKPIVCDFEKGDIGKTPSGYTTGLTGHGGPVLWELVSSEDAPSGTKVIAQLSNQTTNKRYPHIVCNSTLAKDLDVSVKFKTISGEVDASGGIMFRYQDSGNYYVVRANSLEGNVVAYKTEDGERSSIGVKDNITSYGVDVPVPHKEWNTLRVIAQGDLFEIFLNDKKLFEVENNVFNKPGKVGLWTKADAVTHFDDLIIKVLDRK